MAGEVAVAGGGLGRPRLPRQADPAVHTGDMGGPAVTSGRCTRTQRPPALSPMVRRYADHAQQAAITSDFVTDDGFQLGRWADRQRIARLLRTLPRHRTLELDAIGFDWQVTALPQTDAKRRRMLTELAAYRELHGTADVPVNHTTDDDEALGAWVYRQVKRWRTGDLPEDEQAVLALFGVSPGARRRGPRTAAGPS